MSPRIQATFCTVPSFSGPRLAPRRHGSNLAPAPLSDRHWPLREPDDRHFLLSSGTCCRLPRKVIDDIRMSVTEWNAWPDRWPDGEVAEPDSDLTEGRLQPNARGNLETIPPREIRPNAAFYPAFCIVVYRYFFRLCILDYTQGLIF
jgi:hypothetical protein